MANSLNHGDVSTSNTDIDLAWNSYYPILKSFVWRLVLSYSVARWKGQEDDIVDDIMQETAYRIIERNRKAQRGDATPIYVLEHMATTIAINHCKDIRRRDRRLIHIFADCPVGADAVEPDYENVNISEIATEGAYRQALFLALAQEIAQFPEKQRQVLLCDLANHMSFEQQPTHLQAAFLKIGIRLQDYQQPLSSDLAERNKYRSLRYYAYKRVAQLPCVQQFSLEVV